MCSSCKLLDFIRNFPIFSKKLIVSAKSVLHMKQLQITEIATGKICGLTGKKQGVWKMDPVHLKLFISNQR